MLGSRSVVLLARDLFHPVDDFPVERFLNGVMCHRDIRACAMPVLLIRLEPNHITWADFLDRPAPLLNPTGAGRDDQRLAERMRMPGGPRAGFKSDTRPARPRRIGRLKEGI